MQNRNRNGIPCNHRQKFLLIHFHQLFFDGIGFHFREKRVKFFKLRFPSTQISNWRRRPISKNIQDVSTSFRQKTSVSTQFPEPEVTKLKGKSSNLTFRANFWFTSGLTGNGSNKPLPLEPTSGLLLDSKPTVYNLLGHPVF